MPATLLSIIFSNSISAQIQIVPNRQNATYSVGETASFSVTSGTSGALTYSIQYDELTPVIKTGTVQVQAGVPAQVNYAHSEPGLVFIKTSLNGQTGKSAVVFSPNNIFSAEAEPSDFDAFWASQKAQINNVPLDPQVQFIADNGRTKDYSINLGSIDGRRVYGYISVPNGPGPFPALLHCPPFGWNANLVLPDTYISDELGVINMHISVHNNPPDQTTTNPYTPNDVTSREGLYYRYAVLAGLQALNYLVSRPDFDGQHLGVYGESQGGGLSMMLAGLDSRVKLLLSTIPALSDHTATLYGKAAGFPQYLHWAIQSSYGNQNYIESVRNAVKYYDTQYFMKRYTGPLYTAASFLDETCPSASVFAAHNVHRGSQVRVHSTKLAHTHPGSYWSDRPNLVRLHFPTTRTPQNNPYPPSSTGYKVDAGANAQTQVNTPISLKGIIEFNQFAKNGLPAQWNMLSGPASVNFSSATSYTTQATFSQPGTYVLRFSARDEATISADYFYTLHDVVTITVSGSTSLPTINLTDITVQENVGQAIVQLCLSQAAATPTMVTYATQNGSATAGTDYTASSGVLTIPAGTTCYSLTIPIINDSQTEQNESFSVLFTNPQGATLPNNLVTITVLDNDVPVTVPSLLVENISAQENTGIIYAEVCLSEAATIATSISYQTRDGNATANSDYQAISGTISIPAGSICAVIPISLINDTIAEDDEAFFLNFSNPVGLTLVDSSIQITILDDDQALVVPVVGLNSIHYDVQENIGTVEISVCLSTTTNQDVSVLYYLLNDSALGGSDFQNMNGSINIPAGSSCGTVTISIIDDNVAEGSESFSILLAAPINATLGQNTATISILDNDYQPPTISIQNIIVSESVGQAVLSVCLNNAVTQDIKVNYMTSAQSATSEVDFAFTQGELIIPAGTVCGSIPISIFDDTITENQQETFLVTLSNAQNGILGNSFASVTILDNDVPLPVLSIADVRVLESAGVVSVEVCIPTPAQSPITFNYLTNDGTAIAGFDYEASTGSVTIPVGATCASFRINLINDSVEEGDETIQISLANPIGATLPVGIATITILKNDSPVVGPTICEAKSTNFWTTWIQSVELNTLNKQTSGANYTFFENDVLNVYRGDVVTVRLSPGSSNGNSNMYYRIWVDWNNDADFNDVGEVVFQRNGTNSVLGTFNVPAASAEGLVRVRIAAKRNSYPNACETINVGEVEDYLFNITNRPASCSINANISNVVCNNNNTPSDATDDFWNFTLLMSGNNTGTGWKATFKGETYLGFYNLPVTFTVNNPDGLTYPVQVVDQNNATCAVTKNVIAPTPCVEVVVPPAADYCAISASFPWHEWISKVGMNGNVVQTSSKTNYSNYTATPIQLLNSQNQIAVTASYSWLTKPLFWHIWIDYNQNNIFEASEQIARTQTDAAVPGSMAQTIYTKNFTIPSTAKAGQTRMRIVCSGNGFQGPCDNFEFGEVEDYAVTIPNLNLVAPNTSEAGTLLAIQKGSNKVDLSWAIHMDLGEVAEGWIEQAAEGQDFEKIITHFYPSTNQGIMVDENPTFGQNRYRLVLLMQDGALLYTNEVALVLNDCPLYPNPARHQIQVDMSLFKAEQEVSWKITDLMGRDLDGGIYTPNQTNELQIFLKNLQSGLYILTLSAEGRRSAVQRFIVDNG